MWLSLAAIALILAVTYFQALHGMFSAVIMCMLTILSAALAFGAYERLNELALADPLPDHGRAVAFIVVFVAAALLFGTLNAGGQMMQVETDIPIDLILVIQALVVVFIAAPALIRAIYRVRTGDEAARVTKGWAT